jgi:lipoate-protein ligase A
MTKTFFSKSTDIYYHLALEEYLLKHTNDNWLFLWQSEPCVVVGKHQNVNKEINAEWVHRNQIKIARRLSGGGTVYQDLGNVNFTIIKTMPHGQQVNWQTHMHPIYTTLHQMGFPVEYSPRHDLWIEGKKCSGNAEHVYKNRVLHHGTLLYNSDLECLNLVLDAKNKTYTDHSIPSVRSTVGNLSEYSHQYGAVKNWLNELSNRLSHTLELVDLPKNELVKELMEQKYTQKSWILGHFRQYAVEVHFKWQNQTVSLVLNVDKGIVNQIDINECPGYIAEALNLHLLGKAHEYSLYLELLPNISDQFERLVHKFF